MAKSFLTDLNLNNNVLLNAKIQAWGSAPTGTTNPSGSGTAVAGQISSYLGALWVFNGTAWVQVGNTLSDSTSTTSSTTGASSTAVKAAYDLAAAALPKSGGTMTGTLAMGSNNITGTGSISATTFTGALTGNASTATTLATARTINGVSFNGSANITVTATATNALTIGTGLSGTSYNGSSAVTIAATAGSTSAAGILQLSDATNSTSTSLAATANAAKTAYDRGSTGITNAATAQSTADAALPKAGGTMSGAIAMGNSKITGLGTPTADTDAATKLYVDQVAAGLHVHPSVNYATTGALGTAGNLVGGTITTTYNNGTSGVGATLTIATSSNWTAITVDGQTVTANDRILIKNQGGTASNLQNGIYTVTSVGAVGNTTSFVFTRALDADQSPEIDAGDLTYVVAGTANGGDGYVQVVNGVTVGTTAIEWSQFSGSGAVPIATVTSAGLASFPDAQFSVSGAGAVSIDNLGTLAGTFATSGASALTLTTTGTTNATLPSGTVTLMSTSGNTTGSAATLTTSRTLWGQSFNGSADVTGALSSVTTITGTTTLGLLSPSNASTGYAVSLTGGASSGTSAQTGGAVNITGGASTSGTSTNTGGSITITGGAANTTAGIGGNVTINGGLGSSANGNGVVQIGATNTLEVQIGSAVTLSGIATGTAGFVKIGTTGALSRGAIVYTDLPTSSLTGVTTDGIARKKTGPGSGTSTNTFSINHGFGQWVLAQLYDSSGNEIEVDIQNTSTSNGTTIFTFAANQTNMNVYQYVIIG